MQKKNNKQQKKTVKMEKYKQQTDTKVFSMQNAMKVGQYADGQCDHKQRQPAQHLARITPNHFNAYEMMLSCKKKNKKNKKKNEVLHKYTILRNVKRNYKAKKSRLTELAASKQESK